MMETYEKISEDLARKTITTNIDLKALRKELKDIEKEIKDLEKQPNEIMMPNDSKFFRVEQLQNRKEEINNILK